MEKSLKRRILLGALLAAPLATLAQPRSKKFRIAVLQATTPPSNPHGTGVEALKRALVEAGYAEGRNLEIALVWGEGNYARLPELARELVKTSPDVIVASTTPVVQAVQRATRTIPVVMVAVGDPVGSGFVASLARPGGNITGVANLVDETSKKQLELLLATFPRQTRISVLQNPGNQLHAGVLKTLEAASEAGGVRISVVQATGPAEFERAISLMKQERGSAFIIVGDGTFFAHRARLAELALAAGLASIGAQREHAQAGSLMSYGASVTEIYRRGAIYVDKILKGARPADLPVEQPSKLELVINLKTAKALGVTIPQGVLVRADEIIQ